MNWTNLRPHRFWLAGLFLSLTLLIVTPLVTSEAQDRLKKEQEQLTARAATLTAQLAQWKADAAKARELSAAMQGENIEAYLTPASRALLAAQLEPLGAAARLSRLTYTLSPERAWQGDPAFPHVEGLIQSDVVIEGEAALDTDVLRFLKSLSTLPGRISLQRLTISRIDSAGNRTLGTANLIFRAELVWLANAPKGGSL